MELAKMTDSEKLDRLFQEIVGVKSDIQGMKTEMQEMKSDIQGMKTEMREMKSDIQGMKTEMQEMKSDIQGMKTEMQEMKSDIQGMKTEMQEMKTEIQGMKTEMQEMKTDIQEIKVELSAINVRLDNEISVNIQRVAEGHLDLSRNLHEAMKPSAEVEHLGIKVRMLDSEVQELKRVCATSVNRM